MHKIIPAIAMDRFDAFTARAAPHPFRLEWVSSTGSRHSLTRDYLPGALPYSRMPGTGLDREGKAENGTHPASSARQDRRRCGGPGYDNVSLVREPTNVLCAASRHKRPSDMTYGPPRADGPRKMCVSQQAITYLPLVPTTATSSTSLSPM
jgi:hypothetical protein